MRRVDAVIVGAGPAGTAAAIELARAGREVVVADKARFPRDKTCGDGLTTLALRRLEELGLDPGRVASWQPVEDVAVRTPAGRLLDFPLPRGPGLHAAVARRRDLDHALVELARGHGVEVLEGAALVDAHEKDDSVRVTLDGVGDLEASWAIGADGMWSPLRKALGAAPAGYLGEWHAFRQYFCGVDSPAARRLWVFFEPDLLPGYAWSFPLPGNAVNVGFGVRRDGRRRIQDMATTWRELLDRPHIRAVLGDRAVPESAHRAWPIPARIDRATLGSRRALFAGDAAAATDPMTGEGIGQALETGMLAARAILDGSRAGDVVERYRRDVRAALVADHRLAVQLSRVLERPRPAEAAMRLAGSTPWVRRQFARWLFEDYPRAAVVTPRRWRRGLLTGPGAFAGR